MDPGIEQALRGVRLVVFDFDGVFNGNRVWVNELRGEAVGCCRADGFSLRRLAEAGVDTLILTTELVPVPSARAPRVLERRGGEGCVTVLCDVIWRAKGTA